MKNRLMILAVTLMVFCSAQAQTRVIAHRGYWKTEGSAQNSITALLKADSIGCYGSEFDVWITKDNHLIVNHDPKIGPYMIEQTDAKTLTAQKLKNGEHVPTLEAFLKAAKKHTTLKLILELKHHSTPEREDLAAEKIVKLVERMKLQNRVEYITFSANALRTLLKIAPKGTPVYYLNGEMTPSQLKELGCAGLDYHYDVLRKHPEWIDECHRLGMKVNVWTVRSTDVMREFDGRADFLTTDLPAEALNVVNK